MAWGLGAGLEVGWGRAYGLTGLGLGLGFGTGFGLTTVSTLGGVGGRGLGSGFGVTLMGGAGDWTG